MEILNAVFGNLGDRKKQQEFEQVRDRITTDSEDDHLVAGRWREGRRCRARGRQGHKGEPGTALPQGAWSSLGNLDTGRSASREEDHVTKLCLP